jgi:bacterioferritin (cytochrome b1)
MHTGYDELRTPLTEQCSEEAHHAWLINQTIVEMGGTPIKVAKTFQSEIAKLYGMPKSVVDILCLTKVFEERVLAHYQKHAGMKNEDPRIVAMLNSMIEDEAGHVDWIEEALEKYKDQGAEQKLKEAQAIDDQVYAELVKEPVFARYFKEIL